eukprot:scaffold15662_cov109-Isochrysis_galbana.AAC.3
MVEVQQASQRPIRTSARSTGASTSIYAGRAPRPAHDIHDLPLSSRLLILVELVALKKEDQEAHRQQMAAIGAFVPRAAPAWVQMSAPMELCCASFGCGHFLLLFMVMEQPPPTRRRGLLVARHTTPKKAPILSSSYSASRRTDMPRDPRP